MIAVAPYAHLAYLALRRELGLQVTQLVVGGVAIFAGYGAVELMFAAAASIAHAAQMTRNPDWSGALAGLVGAIYVGSRGLGNCGDWIEEKKRKEERREAG